MATEESGWLIERGDSEVSAPKYWAAGQRDAERSSAWTSNHLEAIRFARKVDAEKLAKRLMPSIAVRVCEHGWMDPPKRDRDPEDEEIADIKRRLLPRVRRQLRAP